MPEPEYWLRGPVEGVPAFLQPVAHALLQAREDVHGVVAALSVDELWASPHEGAPLGFHVTHMAGALDRLFTYARGESLDGSQVLNLGRERAVGEPRATTASVLGTLDDTIDRALAQLRSTDVTTLLEPRAVGRQALPSTVLGLLFHAAEHTTRHAGQIVTTAKALPRPGRAIVEAIGVVRSSRNEAIDDGWDRESARIELADSVPSEALAGLDAFSHVEVLFLFHRVPGIEVERGARHPRGNTAWPRVGIFAQRGKNRPNRLGATIVRLVRVDERSLEVAGLDAVDGTPVMDIKPVVAEFLPRGEHRQPAWATELMRDYWKRSED